MHFTLKLLLSGSEALKIRLSDYDAWKWWICSLQKLGVSVGIEKAKTIISSHRTWNFAPSSFRYFWVVSYWSRYPFAIQSLFSRCSVVIQSSSDRYSFVISKHMCHNQLP